MLMGGVERASRALATLFLLVVGGGVVLGALTGSLAESWAGNGIIGALGVVVLWLGVSHGRDIARTDSGDTEAEGYDVAASVENKPSHPFLNSSDIRAPCPACGKEVRNTRSSFLGHWKRTCDAGGVTRSEFRRATGATTDADDMPDRVFRDQHDGARSTDDDADDREDGWTAAATDEDGRVQCPACGTRVDDSRDALLSHWRDSDDCPGPSKPELGRLLDDPVETSRVPDDVLRGGTGSLTDVPGIDDQVANALSAVGYDSVADLRRATQGDLTEVRGVGKARAARIKAAVGGVSDDSGSDSSDEWDTSARQRSVSRTDDTASNAGSEDSTPGGSRSSGASRSSDSESAASSGTGADGWLAIDGGPGRRVPCPACGGDVFNDRDAFVNHWRDKDDCPGPTRSTLERLLEGSDAVEDVPDDVVRPESEADQTAEDEHGAEGEQDRPTDRATLPDHPEFATRLSTTERRLDAVADALDGHDGGLPEDLDERLGTAADQLDGAAALLTEVQAERAPDRLTAVAGVGDSRARALRNAGYTSVDDLRAASTDDLAAIEGIGDEFATRLKAAVGEPIQRPTPVEAIDRVGEARARTLARAGFVTADDLREAAVEDLEPVVGERLATHLKNEVGGGARPEPAFVGPVADAHERLSAAWTRWRDLRERVERERARVAIADDRERAEHLAEQGDGHRDDGAYEDAASAYREARDAYADALDALPEGFPEATDIRDAKAAVETKLATAAATPDLNAAAEASVEAESLADDGEYEAALDRLRDAQDRYRSARDAAREHDPDAEVVTECEAELDGVAATIEDVRAERDRAAVEPHVEAAEEHETTGDDRHDAEEYEAAADAYAAAVEAYEAALDEVSDAFDGIEDLRDARTAAERKHAAAERDAHVAAADARVDAAEDHRDDEAYAAAVEAYETGVDRLRDAVDVTTEYDLDGADDLRARIDDLASAATTCRLSELSARIVEARESARDDPDAAESELESVLSALDDIDTERERDVGLLEDEARRGLVEVATARGERCHETAREQFAGGDHDAARETFETARERFEAARALVDDHDLDVGTDELSAATEVCEANADTARQAFYGLTDGDASLRPLPWDADREAAAPAAEETAGERSVTGRTPSASASGPRGGDTGTDAGTPAEVTATLPEYDEREWIGSGGNADVYRVETADGDVAALKTPRWEGTMHESAVQEFVDEAETWERLDRHDHIVNVLDWGTRPHPWLLLEYLPGSLADAGDLSLAERLDALVAVADALEYAHGRGVVHLDVKPENVLLTEEGVPKIGDWGLARLVLDHAGEQTGMTLAYSAPEQLDADATEVDRQVDVYQFGVLSYEVLTGRKPFSADERLELRRAIMEDDPTPPSEVADLPPELDEVVLRGLAADRDERYEACIQFRDALREVHGGLD